jgi:hypothetical protein
MKTTLFLVTLLVLAGFAYAVAANPPWVGQCFAITDNALRQQCLAEVSRNSAQCYNIVDSDSKNYCLAITRHNRAFCYSITNADKKAYCLAVTP